MTKNQIENLLRKISNRIMQNYQEIDSIGVLSGLSGIALFQFYCGRYFQEEEYLNRAASLIKICLEKIESGYTYPSYSRGICGFAWVLQHLIDEEFIENTHEETFNYLEDYLYKCMEKDYVNGNYDFLHGGLGYSYYFLKRYNSATKPKALDQLKQFLLRSIELLKSTSEKKQNKYFWTSLHRDNGVYLYNLGLAHGIPSILNFLCLLYEKIEFRGLTEKLFQGAYDFISSYQNTNGIGTKYPNGISQNLDLDYNSRLAWCYGDLGICATYDNVRKVIKSRQLEDQFLALKKSLSLRKDISKNMVDDAGICHGAFGIAQCFMSLNHNSDLDSIIAYWIEIGLSMEKYDTKVIFEKYNSFNNSYEESLVVLDGIAGIGLCLIDYISPQKTTWSNCIMLN